MNIIGFCHDSEINNKLHKIVTSNPLNSEFTVFQDPSQLKQSNKLQPDLILFEFTNPDKFGKKELLTLRQMIDIPIIAIIGPKYEKEAITLLSNGVSDYIAVSDLTANLLHNVISKTMARSKPKLNNIEHTQSQNNSLMYQLFENNPLSIVILDKDSTIINFNSRFQQLLGYNKRESKLNHSIFDLTVKEDYEKSKLFFDDLVTDNGHSYSFDQRLLDSDQDPKWVNITAFTINAGKENFSIVQIVRDISKVKENEQLLEEQAKEIESTRKLESYGFLAGGIAHDFNNYLTTIRGYTELAANISDNPKVEEYLEKVIDSTDKASKLTSSLLIFSSNSIKERKVIDVNLIIKGMELILERVGSHIDLQLNLCNEELSVYINPSLLEDIILNLVINAKDAIEHSGYIKIDTNLINVTELEGEYAFEQEKYIQIKVSDNGSGIPEEILPSIYDPFFTTREVGKGTGLGLTNVKRIVENHDGVISVDTKLDEGTTFEIYLPEYSSSSIAEYRKRDRSTTPYTSLSGIEILLIEDNPGVKEVLEEQLKLLNATVYTASNGSEGLDLLLNNETKIDLIITDIQMPKMSGPELIQMVHKYNNELPIIVISANHTFDTSTIEQPISFLSKPFSIDILLQEITSILKLVSDVD